jgi:hypothetical protein
MPAACFHVRFQASASGYPYAFAYFLTDSLGRTRGIRGDSLENLRLPGSEPDPLADTVRSRMVVADVALLGRHLRDVLLAHGFSVPDVDSVHVATDVLKLGARWEDRPVVERIDCGHWAEGGNRVLLPLSRDSAQGYGHLLVGIRARLESRATTALVVLDPDVWLNPPWFEQGDRPMMPCELRASFVKQLLDEVALRSRDSAAPN